MCHTQMQRQSVSVRKYFDLYFSTKVTNDSTLSDSAVKTDNSLYLQPMERGEIVVQSKSSIVL